jgi:hypothetical protein
VDAIAAPWIGNDGPAAGDYQADEARLATPQAGRRAVKIEELARLATEAIDKSPLRVSIVCIA